MDPLSQHEALDRCSVMVAMVNEHLLEHQYVQGSPEIKAKVEKAVELLAEAYQDIGQYSVKEKELQS